ncbi:uncharacterized protein L203_101220 [Cryptococcus depauperatus CBS 7841]|uniref:Uncharacterized protein n=1 Tax=Cryptococcus depauperatus CBS 7841 TaxID=1295531 RepID=A0A1E3HF13_9TREE|nr:peptide alpha-N-acetyltransferase [Cryptococcus depauperatus CBS 7841]
MRSIVNAIGISRSAVASLALPRSRPVVQLSTLVVYRRNAGRLSMTSSRGWRYSSTYSEGPHGPDSSEPKTAYARFKVLTKKYGYWAIGMYLFLSTIDFSFCFILVHSLGAERIAPMMDSAKELYRSKRYGKEEAERMKIEDQARRKEEEEAEKRQGKKNNGSWFGKTFWAEAVLAYTLHKTALLPIRAGLTVAWTPKFVGWLTKRGWVGKGGLTRAASHAQTKVKATSERMKNRVKRNET